MKRFLVTGFEAFDGHSENPSKDIVEFFKAQSWSQENFEFEILPVTFGEAYKTISHLPLESFEGVIMLGQAGGRAHICFERVALNWVESEKADNAGKFFEPGFLHAEQAHAHFSSAPIQKWLKEMEAHFPNKQKVSHSAGAFVCNALFYQVAERLKGTQTWSVFIHLPYKEGQGEPFVPLAEQKIWFEKFFRNLV